MIAADHCFFVTGFQARDDFRQCQPGLCGDFGRTAGKEELHNVAKGLYAISAALFSCLPWRAMGAHRSRSDNYAYSDVKSCLFKFIRKPFPGLRAGRECFASFMIAGRRAASFTSRYLWNDGRVKLLGTPSVPLSPRVQAGVFG